MTILAESILAAQKDVSNSDNFYALFRNAMLFLPLHPDGSGKVVVEQQGETFMPVFDSMEKLQEWSKADVSYVRELGSDILKSLPKNVVLILNPGSVPCKRFYAEEIDTLTQGRRSDKPLSTTEIRVDARVSPSNKKTPKLVSDIHSYLEDFPEVESAYLGESQETEGIRAVVALEMAEGSDDVFDILRQNLPMAIQKYFGEMMLDVVMTSDRLGVKVAEEGELIYSS